MKKGSKVPEFVSRCVMTSLALAFSATLAIAQPVAPQVRNITISSDLNTKLEKELGIKEADLLKQDLRRSVERALQKAPGSTVTFVDLVIEDAAPTRPTFQQLSRNTSLSYSGSASLGGAKVLATLFDSTGTQTKTVTYSYYESDLRQAFTRGTWSDAETAFMGAATKIRKASTPTS